MENQPKRSLTGAFVRGLVFTAITGALMAGIFSGVGAAAFALSGGTIGAELGMGALSSIGLVAASTGIFGGLLQTYSAINSNKQADIGYTRMRGNDVAITAASNNLIMQPQLQTGTSVSPDLAPEIAQAQSTTFRDKVGGRPGINERMNSIIAGRSSATSHTDRVDAERAALAQTQGRTA